MKEKNAHGIDMSRVQLATGGAAEHARHDWGLSWTVSGAAGAVTMVFENTKSSRFVNAIQQRN